MFILTRYILGEFASNLGLGLTVFTFILLLDKLFELVDLLMRKGVGLLLTLKMLALLIPSSITLTLPVSFLLAALLTYGRLSENNEITAMKASGIAPWSFMKTSFGLAVAAVILLIPFNSDWAPRVHSEFRKIYVEVLHRNPLVRIEEKTFVEVGEYHVYVRRKDKRRNELDGVTIYRTTREGAPIRIFADRGKASVDPVRGIRLDLSNGRIEQIDPVKPDQWYTTGFETYSLSIPFHTTVAPEEKSVEEMTNAELAARIRELKAKGIPSVILVSHRHLRWALAMTPLLFVLLAIPLALQLSRGGRSIGFALSLSVAMGYYVLLMATMGLGQRGVWPAGPSVWISNAVLLTAGILFYRRFQNTSS